MAAFLALNGGAVLAAFAFAVALGLGERRSRLFLGALAGYLVIVHSAVLVAGLTGFLTPAGLATVVGVFDVVALWMLHRRRRRADGALDRTDGGFTAAAVFAPALAVVCAIAWTWPHLAWPTRLWVWDDYTYHMVYPALWLRERAIAAVGPAETFTMQAWYPMSGGVTAAWFAAPFAGSRAAALAWVSLTGVLYAGIVAVGAAETLARLGCRAGAWAVPVVLLATSSRIEIMASSFSDVDLAVAATLFGAFAFAMPRGDGESPSAVAVDAAYAALLSGFALGVKVSAAPVALIVLGMFLARLPRAAARTLAGFVVGWAATAGYWYARNLAHTGNPVYPAAFLLWPGVRFSESTLLEYAQRYGVSRTVADALLVYTGWPLAHALLAAAGLLGLCGWTALGWRSATPARRSFGAGALAIAGTMLVLLPAAPFSAGNALTFRAGIIHWDSMRYVALLPILGWTALGFVVDAAMGGRGATTLASAAIAVVGVLAAYRLPFAAVLAAVAAATAVLVLRRWDAWPRRTLQRDLAATTVAAVILGALALWGHDRKTAVTAAALRHEPLFGGATAVLDAQPPGTRVAVFGDQWVYPTFGDRHHLRPVRLDRDGRVASAPIGGEMTPGAVAVDAATFRANLRAAGIGVVVVIQQPHPGRPAELPTQHAALERAGGARVLYRDRAVVIWQLDP